MSTASLQTLAVETIRNGQSIRENGKLNFPLLMEMLETDTPVIDKTYRQIKLIWTKDIDERDNYLTVDMSREEYEHLEKIKVLTVRMCCGKNRLFTNNRL